MKKIGVLCALLFMLPSFAGGDIAAGREKNATCMACHGNTGHSSNPIWPNLAGQHASYIFKQLQDFKAGKTRNNPSMTGMVAPLSEQDMHDLAAYYASFTVAEGQTPKKYLERGARVYRGGDFKRGVTACIACHGPNGMGNQQARFPVLSGQHAQYTIQQLQAFKKGKRSNDLNGIMQGIASRMSTEDIEAVAYYIQGLH